MTQYIPTEIKRAIRLEWDLPIIETVSELLERPLSYFGLPGPDVQDLQDWREYLGVCTTIEKDPDPNVQRLIRTNAIKLGLQEQGFQLLLGDIDDILLNGRDSLQVNPSLDWYDLFNLDYCGGWLYKDRHGKSKRGPRTIEALIHRQRKKADDKPEEVGLGCFVLLVTVNVRSRDRGEIPVYIRKDIARIVNGAHAQALCSLPEGGVEHWHLKYYVVQNIVQLATTSGFLPFVFPPLYYSSGRSFLVHFASVLKYVPRQDAVVVPKQSTTTLMRLPMATVKRLKVTGFRPLKALVPFCDPLRPIRKYVDEMEHIMTESR